MRPLVGGTGGVGCAAFSVQKAVFPRSGLDPTVLEMENPQTIERTASGEAACVRALGVALVGDLAALDSLDR